MKFNYDYQVWWDEATSIIEECSHPVSMRPFDPNTSRHCQPCCNQFVLAGFHIEDLENGSLEDQGSIEVNRGRVNYPE